MPYSFANALARSFRSGWVWYSAIMRCLPPANPEPCLRSSFSISACDKTKAEGVFSLSARSIASICWASVGRTASRKLSCRSAPSAPVPLPALSGCSCAAPTPSAGSLCPGPGSVSEAAPWSAASGSLPSAPPPSGAGTGSRSGASCCTVPGAAASESSGASCRTCPAGSSADTGSGSGEDNPRSACNSDCCSYSCWLLSALRRRMVVFTVRSIWRKAPGSCR